MKKLITLVLALAMVLSLGVSAFASDTTSDTTAGGTEKEIKAGSDYSVALTGSTKAATLKAVVPTTGQVIINPLQLEVTVEQKNIKDQIISATQSIQNLSDCNLEVKAKAIGTEKGNAKLVDTAEAANAEDEKLTVYMYMESLNASAGTEPAKWDNAATMAVVSNTATAPEATKIMVLDAKGTKNGKDYCVFRLNGAAENTADWTTDDTVSVAITFNFNGTVEAAGMAGTGLKLADGSATSASVNGTTVTFTNPKTNDVAKITVGGGKKISSVGSLSGNNSTAFEVGTVSGTEDTFKVKFIAAQVGNGKNATCVVTYADREKDTITIVAK